MATPSNGHAVARDLASRANVDPRTARRFLDSPERLKPKIRQRIEKAIAPPADPIIAAAEAIRDAIDALARIAPHARGKSGRLALASAVEAVADLGRAVMTDGAESEGEQ